jgi:uncharacterized radical SAM protein YgiQ
MERKLFLPLTAADAEARGWKELDFIIITGDAYVDHPAWGAALIGRLLEREGYRVGIIAQPDWRAVSSFRKLGKPVLAFLVTAGNLDSMVNKYTANKKPRSTDDYSPGGKAGFRPDRATLVYTSMAKQAFSQVPVILGGIEASLRRLSHYDYWSDKVRRSLISDAKADLLIYGMAERALLETAAALKSGRKASELTEIRGTVYRTKSIDALENFIRLPDFDAVKTDKKAFAESFAIQYANTDPFTGRILAEFEGDFYAVQNPPPYPAGREELDSYYQLPFTRAAHPDYDEAGGVPALEEVRFSLVSSRGCFGACSFCSLTFHQGKIISSRSHSSIIEEAAILSGLDGFKGYIHDVGGPTANFRHPACSKQAEKGSCTDKSCLGFKSCPKLYVSHADYLELLRKLKKLPGIKKVFIRSGLRFDYLMQDGDESFFSELVRDHVSGQLKVAPEHVSAAVLKLMHKPAREVFTAFKLRFEELNRKHGKKQFLVPYFISAHPGAGLKEAVELAEYLRDSRINPEQVQDFYPTPGTLSTCMYHTGFDPLTMKAVYTAKGEKDRKYQRALLQYRKKENKKLVIEALVKAGRTDLIGRHKKALVSY